VNRISGVLPVLVGVTEVGEVGGEGVGIEEDDVVWVFSADDLVHFVVEFDEAGVFRISGLVQRVVAGDPLVAFVVLGKLGPEPEDTVLEVLVVPDCANVRVCRLQPRECVGLTVGNVASVVGVPISVLTTGSGVKVKDGVDTVLGADIDDTVKVVETRLLENTRVHVVYMEY
jgi:hypothetical protein